MTKRIARRRPQIGLTVADYDTILEAQGGGCAICQRPPKTRRLNCDHDHKTGEVRGLLCHSCNRRLWVGVTVRWLSSAITYLNGCAPGAAAVGDFNDRKDPNATVRIIMEARGEAALRADKRTEGAR